ncbi:hypothetical protein [Prosthecochloris sp. GSB1]|nr:hypothetical protein [Prosthecochloris sp. GSB1]
MNDKAPSSNAGVRAAQLKRWKKKTDSNLSKGENDVWTWIA